MKFILILSCLALYVAHTQAQCRGKIPNNRAQCSGGRNEGHSRNAICTRSANGNMWWYDRVDRTCKPLAYRGCSGNNNRHCTRADCERRCRR